LGVFDPRARRIANEEYRDTQGDGGADLDVSTLPWSVTLEMNCDEVVRRTNLCDASEPELPPILNGVRLIEIDPR
jgi:hypothetical protein